MEEEVSSTIKILSSNRVGPPTLRRELAAAAVMWRQSQLSCKNCSKISFFFHLNSSNYVFCFVHESSNIWIACSKVADHSNVLPKALMWQVLIFRIDWCRSYMHISKKIFQWCASMRFSKWKGSDRVASHFAILCSWNMRFWLCTRRTRLDAFIGRDRKIWQGNFPGLQACVF